MSEFVIKHFNSDEMKKMIINLNQVRKSPEAQLGAELVSWKSFMKSTKYATSSTETALKKQIRKPPTDLNATKTSCYEISDFLNIIVYLFYPFVWVRRPSFLPSFRPPIRPSFRPSTRPFIHLSICSFIPVLVILRVDINSCREPK